MTQPAQTVTLTAGSTSTVTFTNTPLKGNLTVQKSVNYGSLKGFQFRLYGTSTIGKSVDVTVSTDSSGVAAFTNVYVGTYTLEELDPGKAYLPVSSKTVTISANVTTGAANTATASFTNTYKYWNATITKVDADTTTAQADATLDGAEYTLYRNGTAVKTYTVQNGTFTTDSYPCTSSDSVYTLKETKAPTGYQLDNTVYPLTTSYDHYTSASNNIKLTVSDKVIIGNLQITKYAYNTVSKEQQPEKGAVFHVWLKSAGSYENASDDVRDTITIGDDGKGTSKNLPYGLYCVKQVSGWEGYDVDETAYHLRTYRNKAYYSLDRGDGIENHVLFTAATPDELYEKKLTNQQLHAAISQLPEKQAKRIYAYYFLDMDEPTIARTEGVSHQAVHSSIQHGLKRIEKILKNSF